jgi:hypothetical protein
MFSPHMQQTKKRARKKNNNMTRERERDDDNKQDFFNYICVYVLRVLFYFFAISFAAKEKLSLPFLLSLSLSFALLTHT